MFGLDDNDQALITRALQGSERAWLTLVRRYEKRVYNLSLRLCGNRQDALDLTQEAFLAVYRNLPNFRGECVFVGWLLRIASHRGVDFLRRRHTNPLHAAGEVDEDHSDHRQSASHATEQQRLRSALNRQMQQLSAEQRVVVELKFFQHLTFDEIAVQIGISENTAKTRLYSALTKLRSAEELQHAL